MKKCGNRMLFPIIKVKKNCSIGQPVAFLFAVFFFLCSCFLVSRSLSGAYRIELTASAVNTDYWQLFFSAALNHPKFSENFSSDIERLSGGEKVTLVFPLHNHPVTWLRIDPGGNPGVVRLYDLKIKRRLAQERIFHAADIYNSFHPGHAGVTMVLCNGFVDIISTEEDPFIISNSPVCQPEPLGMFVVPVFFLSFFFYQWLKKCNSRQLRDFFLVRRERSSTAWRMIEPLDGLRGVAALMVVADHTWPRFIGVGASGVLIFFTLSGFLLARPFVLDPEKIRESGFLMRYGKRRLRRILPMYYVYILLVYVMSLDLGAAVLHAFFVQGAGHLWAVPQEMLFYLIFPVVALSGLFLLRGKIGWIVLVIVGLAMVSNGFFGLDVFSLYGMNGQPIPFYLGVFLSGCAASYLYFGWYEKKIGTRENGAGWRFGSWSLIGPGVFLFLCFFSSGYLFGRPEVWVQQFYGVFGLAATVLLFSLLAEKRSFLARIFCHSGLRTLGVISYSFYLLHPLVLAFILDLNGYFLGLNLQGGILFLLTVCCTVPLAVLTYRLVELPFLVVRSA